MKKRPFAYISAPWSGNEGENIENAAKYSRIAYEAGLTPLCPYLLFPPYIRETVAEELKDMKDMSRELLKRSAVLVVCGNVRDESVLEDIATAKRRGITTTTLDGLLIGKEARRRRD